MIKNIGNIYTIYGLIIVSYMFKFKIKLANTIIFFGVYVPFVLVIFMPMTRRSPINPFGSWKSQCVFKILGSRWGINIVPIRPSLNHHKCLEEYYNNKKTFPKIIIVASIMV
jgi:hypothetical protein